jgi:hypothetical protein
MPCQISIQGLQTNPPYANGDEPTHLQVVGRSSAYCTRVRVVVYSAGPGSPTLFDQPLDVDFSNAFGQTGIDFGLIVATFNLPQVGLRCGDQLYVEMRCVADPGCQAQGWFSIACKPRPQDLGGSSGTPGSGNGSGSWTWPPSRCLFTAATAAFLLLAGLGLLALGIGTQNAASVAAGAGLIAAAGVAWALWEFWCGPTRCVRLGVLCWVFKRAFIVAIPVLFFSTAPMIVLVLIGYGSAAGLLVRALRASQCPVPSARLPLTQIPI